MKLKLKPQLVLMLSAILIAGVLLDGLLCAHAQAARLAVEETLCETLKEGGLSEEPSPFFRPFFLPDPQELCTDRRFSLYVDSADSFSAVCLYDGMMPLRI